MDPAMVRTVSNWPVPDSRKSLQQFLGFANFYQRFNRNLGQVAAPLTALTSTKAKFAWTAAQSAFDELKWRFISASILVTPDSAWQFVVEVDASEVCVGAVLSKISPQDKLHCLPQSKIMTSSIESCWWNNWLWGIGVTGWRGWPFLSWCGTTTGTWSTFVRLNG